MNGIFVFEASGTSDVRRFTFHPYAGRRIAQYLRDDLKRLKLYDGHSDVHREGFLLAPKLS